MPVITNSPFFIPPPVAWELSAFSYDSVSFGPTFGGISDSYGMHGSPDGTRFYVTDDVNNGIRQVNLSSGWDLSTASNSTFFSVSAQNSSVGAVALRDNGTKMYFANFSNGVVYQYTLSTPWELSTASYDSTFLIIASQLTACRGVRFSSDGTKMYAMNTAGAIFQYTLSTPWDIGTGSYASKSFSPSEGYGFDLRPDGTKLYVIGSSSNVILQHTLSVAWDISTASYDGVSISTDPPETGPTDIVFRPDGTRFIIYGFTSHLLYQFSA